MVDAYEKTLKDPLKIESKDKFIMIEQCLKSLGITSSKSCQNYT